MEKPKGMEGQVPAAFSAAPNGITAARKAYLILGPESRITYASSSVRSVLKIASDAPLLGIPIDIVLRDACSPQHRLTFSVGERLERKTTEPSTGDDPPVVLLTATQARTIHLHFESIGDAYWVINLVDVTADPGDDRRLLLAASRDHLTGISNRAYFEIRLDAALVDIETRQARGLTLLFLDLDRFKTVNDTLGHAVGDALLKLVSERLQHSVREDDTLARLGGDEFAILLDGMTEKDVAGALARRTIDMLERPYLIDGQVVNIGASIGIALAPQDGTTREQLLKSADLALYYSKAAGRGVCHFFQLSMQEQAQQRRALELDLRKALLLRQFELYYQPQINVETGTVIGLEGLLRWKHPKRGLLLPAEFLSLAEELGLAVSIGDWVLKTACREAMRWPESVSIAVNVSPLQFALGDLAASAEKALKAAGLPGDRLEIEVSENVLLRNGDTVLTTLLALRALGVRVAMDRFGTGVASLSQVVNFPFNKIKIDRSLVRLDGGDAKNRAIVRAISALGLSLGMSTVAEGVETAEHLAQVRADGCHSVQGFYYSKAVPSSELPDLVSQFYLPTSQDLPLSKEEAYEQSAFQSSVL